MDDSTARDIATDDAAYERAYERGRSDALLGFTNALPLDAPEARVGAHAALLRWQDKADQARRIAWESDQYALQGDGLRVRCSEDLQATQGLSVTAADKAASNHPDYLAYKAEARRLSKAKADAELLRDIAYQTLQNHREYLRERTAALSLEVGHAIGVALGRAQDLRGGTTLTDASAPENAPA